jgi:hypothetical protein
MQSRESTANVKTGRSGWSVPPEYVTDRTPPTLQEYRRDFHRRMAWPLIPCVSSPGEEAAGQRRAGAGATTELRTAG